MPAKDTQRVHNHEGDRHGADERPRARRGSRLIWLASRLLVVAVLLAVLLYFAPLIITSTGAWKSILSAAVPEVAPLIEVQALQLSWLAPIEVRGLVVRDPSGAPLAEVPAVRSRKTLLAIALDPRAVGAFDVVEPRVRIVLRADGSNIEDLLAKLPKSDESAEPVGFGVALAKGAVEFVDQVAGKQWQLGDLSADIAWPAAPNQAKTGKLAGYVMPAETGQFAAEFTWQPGSNDKRLGAGQAKLTLLGIPTELAQGTLTRFAADIRPRGPLTVQTATQWNQESNAAQVVIERLETPGLSVASPALLGPDQPTVAIASGQADIAFASGRTTIRNLDLRSNFLSVAGKAAAAADNLAGSGDIEVTGQLNLVELARQLPATLRLKDDTQVTSGTAAFTLVSRADGRGRDWQASLKTANIRGTAAGRPVQFDQPLEVVVDIQQTPQGPAIERLLGKASFLHLEGRGTLASGNITARADLHRLVSDLGRLVDWGDTRLAGTVGAELRWQQDQATGWTAAADVNVQNFEVQASNLAPWKEPSLRLMATTVGILDDRSLEQIRGGKLVVEAGADRLEADLTEPVRRPSASSVWPLKFTLRGELASWAPRLQPLVALGDWRMAGAISAAGSARAGLRSGELGPMTLEIYQFALDGPGVSIREPGAPGAPGVKVETAAAWDATKSALVLGSTTFATSAVAFRADDVRLVMGKEPSVTGQVDFRSDLARLSNWFTSSQQPRTSELGGSIVGHLDLGYRGQSLAANWNADIDNVTFKVAPPPSPAPPPARTALASATPAAAWQTIWHEPRITIAGQGTFEPGSGTLRVERTSLAATGGSLLASGMLTKLGAAPEIDLSGEIQYDLETITRQIRSQAQRRDTAATATLPYGLDTLQLVGKEQRKFLLKGPLLAATGSLSPAGVPAGAGAPPRRLSDLLVGEASLGWQGAQYVGLVAGPADFTARLAGGIINIGPLDIPLAEGRLTTAPRVVLTDPVPAVVVDRGPLVQNVRISPEMCRLWLKYVTPVVADATSAEGRFSLTLEGANVPLSAPIASTLAGTLAIQSAQIGPGPLAQQYLGLARQLKGLLDGAGAAIGQAGSSASTATDEPARGWLIMPQQDVHFEVRDGVATNRGLKMTIGDVVITTQGSVHIESQKINIVASIPLHESWFKGQAGGLLTSLKGQTIQVPIDGTLTQPRFDSRILQNLGQQLAGSALQGVLGRQLERGQEQLNRQVERGQGLLQGELSRGLDRLFGPRQPPQPQPAPPPQPPSPAPR